MYMPAASAYIEIIERVTLDPRRETEMTQTRRTYELTEDEALLAFRQIQGHCQAIKNWMATAVERGDLEYAQKLVAELRAHEVLFAKLNVEAHRFVDRQR